MNKPYVARGRQRAGGRAPAGPEIQTARRAVADTFPDGDSHMDISRWTSTEEIGLHMERTGAGSGMPPTDVTALIRTELPRLAGSLRKVGELILEDPAAVTHCSAAELGRRTGTSQATVTRFCRAIGLDSYQHLLIELAQERGRGEVSDWGTAEIGPDISPADTLARVVTVVGSADLRAVQQTIDRIDLDAVERAAQALARARRIDVYGVGGSGAVAQETETRLF